MANIICPSCKKEMSSDEMFCPHCGYMLSMSEREEALKAANSQPAPQPAPTGAPSFGGQPSPSYGPQPDPQPAKAGEPAQGGNMGQLAELKQMLDAGVISQADYDRKKNEILFGGKSSSSGASNPGKLALLIVSWGSAIFMMLGIMVDIIIGLGVWGSPSAMYILPDLYAAGFIVSAVALISTGVCVWKLLLEKKKNPNDAAVKLALKAIIIFAIITAALLVVGLFDLNNKSLLSYKHRNNYYY